MKYLRFMPAVASLLCMAAWTASIPAWSAPATATPPPAPAAPVSPAVSPEAAKVPDYVRIAEDAASTRLEVCVTTFTLPDGRNIDLFGVVHLADASYYKELNRRLGTYDSVLFELVGNPEALQNPNAAAARPQGRPHPLRGIQKLIGDVFKLDFQLEKIDYTRPNFVHADTSAEEFAKMQAERGESMMKLLLKSFQMSGDPALQEKLKDAENVGLADMIMLFYSQKTMQRIKVIFARVLAESESLLEDKLLGKDNAIVAGRNGVALKKLKEVMADPGKKRVAVFYGAGHMPTLEPVLTGEWKATRGEEAWLPAWTMPAPVKAAAPARDSAPESAKPGV
ncbi:MAG: signal peptide protein [Verrucomicrobiales bacterium]|nr:signal peptide protein [Verrucomicrobiales bacterium]